MTDDEIGNDLGPAMADGLAVLLIVDDPADEQQLRDALAADSEATYRIECVGTLADATSRLGLRPPPHIALLDLSLPTSSGLDTFHRTVAENGHTPLVVLTSAHDEHLGSAAVEAGAQDYLVKGSVTGEVVGRVVRHAVDRHRLQEALRERVKEQTGLFAISQTLLAVDFPADVCAAVAGHLAGAMQWPSLVHVAVTMDDAHATTGPTPPSDLPPLSATITVGDTDRGRLVVTYVEPDLPFILPEEQRLLDSVAEAIAGWLAHQDAVQQLADEGERLRVLMGQLPGAVWTTDAELRITSHTGAMLANLGIGPTQFHGRAIVELFESDPPGETLDRFESALGGEPQVFERRWRGRWWRNYLEPKRDASGAITGTVCLTLDITTERQKQELLEAERARFQGLFVNASDAMILADDDGAYIDANPAACDLTGYDREELLSLHGWDLAAGNDGVDNDVAMAMWQQFIEAGALAGEFPIRRNDGTTVQADFRAVANIVPGVHLSTLRDVTARAKAAAALAISEARFRNIAESSRDAIYQVRLAPELVFEYVSPAVETITGFPPQAFYDNPQLFLDRTSPEDADILDPAPSRPDAMPPSTTIRLQHADGHWIWLEASFTVEMEQGHPVAALGVVRDVTAREQTDQALRSALQTEQQAADRLRDVDDLKSSFLQAISHELRTPLTSVLGYARTLVEHGDRLTAEQAADFHHRIAANASRLDALLEDLLDLQRLDVGTVRLNLLPTDLVALAARAAATVDLGDRVLHLNDAPAVAMVDASKVERVVRNLLANVAKHTPPGVTIWVTCDVTDQLATVTVSDDGPGIAEEDRDNVFDPFWQAEDLRTAASPGTGIGLTLVRRVAALHGGTAWVDPRPGGGSSFHVTFSTRQGSSSRDAGVPELPVVRTVTHDETETTAFREMMHDTVEQLEAVRSADEATGILLSWIQRLGGLLTPSTADDVGILDIDLSLGTPQPMRASAPPGSRTRNRLDDHLPFLVLHARRVLTRRTDTPVFVTTDDLDPATGILRPDAIDRMLEHLHRRDVIAVLTLEPGSGTRSDEGLATMQHLADLAHRLGRTSDRAVLTSTTELVLLLPDTPDDRAAAALARIQEAWQADTVSVRALLIGTATVAAGAAVRALADARADLQR